MRRATYVRGMNTQPATDIRHAHGPAHDHGHGHAHGHSHEVRDFGFAFAAATLLNFALVAAQVFYGLTANSIALLADAGHNFGDALGLLLAWIAFIVGRWHPTERHTYGFRSASILAALSNAVLMLIATGAIAVEAIRRFTEPSEVVPVVKGGRPSSPMDYRHGC